MRKLRLATALATAGVAVAASLAVGAPANAAVFDFQNNISERYVASNNTTVRLYAVIDSSHRASYAYVTRGYGSVQARAQCQRGDGRTSWYQSTINASTGGTSHYDCDNNGTYNRAVVGLGVDIH